MEKEMSNLFVYGSLMFQDIFEAVVKAKYSSVAGTLTNWRRMALINEVYPGLIYGSGSVEGLVWENISPKDMAALDLFEGEYYERISVYIDLKNGERRQCFTYKIADKFRHLVDTHEWSPTDFEKQGISYFKQTYCGFTSC